MNHPHPVFFKDSAAPGNISNGSRAYVYINGFAWSQHDIDRMGLIRRVSVRPEAYWAKLASTIDIEPGAADPINLVPFLQVRIAHGFLDGTGYVNRSNWDECKHLVAQAAESDRRIGECLWWVATLDGTWTVPGAWAVQGQGGPNAPYDLSRLYGHDFFHKP